MPQKAVAGKAPPPPTGGGISPLALGGGMLGLVALSLVMQRFFRPRTPKDWSDPAPLPKEGFLGDYKLGSLVADGGTATVYFGKDPNNAPCAIKIPHRGPLRNRSFVETFQREAQIGVDLRHPSIVRVLAAGNYKAPGFPRIPYFIMEFLEGQELESILEAGRLEEADAVGVGRAVADALAWAHARGVIHRDISPRNIFITTKRSVKVMDFGISTVSSKGSAGRGKARGLAYGTPDYMAPERLQDSGLADERSDLYALGCVLYEMLTGVPPYHGSTAEEILKGHLKSPIPTLADKGLASPQLDAIITRLMAKKPTARFQTASEVAAKLAELIQLP